MERMSKSQVSQLAKELDGVVKSFANVFELTLASVNAVSLVLTPERALSP